MDATTVAGTTIRSETNVPTFKIPEIGKSVKSVQDQWMATNPK